ncbi:MAG TPA: HAMP domain-containing sensor histidine kinase [Stellaceae bacterium]|nr:HAMP domain-containing sensor histidine kinase [Stellaceae bacterium]
MPSRTLAARMVAVLLLGLVLAQLLSFAANFLDRGRAFYRSTTLQAAEHIADIVNALDAVGPEDRARIVARLTGRRLSVALTAKPDLADGVSEQPYASAFQTLLRRQLGPGWALRVIVHRSKRRTGSRAPFFSETPGNALDRYLTLQLFYLAPRGFAFVTNIRLHDGSWVRFSAPLPYEHITRLYILLPKLLVMFAIVLALLLVAVRWVTSPMKRMAQAALALGQNLDRVPLAESGPAEIRATARALNVMQLRLQEYVRDRAAMLAALSHDLKTFITRLRLRTELLPESRHRDRLIGDLGEMATMVDATLDYLHGIGPDRDWAQFDVTALVESIRIDAEEMGWDVALSGAAREPFCGNAQELRRCVTNLVDNAVKYGGKATIRLDDRLDELTIAVCDPGPGIMPEERERVFEPFYRSQFSRGAERAGTGLGLHIARTIARAHGGEVILEPDTPAGFCVALHLPRA